MTEQMILFSDPSANPALSNAETTQAPTTVPVIHETLLTNVADLPPTASPLVKKRLDATWALFGFPFFSLASTPTKETFHYRDDKGFEITITPSAAGAATMHDKGMIIYAISLFVKLKKDNTDRGLGLPGRHITFIKNDYLKCTGRDRSGGGYKAINDTITRLQGTVISTNIERGGAGKRATFTWVQSTITHYVPGKSGRKQIEAVTITLPEWLYEQLCASDLTLEYHPGYWELSLIERRIYEIARTRLHKGYNAFRIDYFQQLVGSKTERRKFKYELNQVIKLQRIPGHTIALIGDPSSPITKALERDGYKVTRPRNEVLVAIMRNQNNSGLKHVLQSDSEATEH